MQLKCIAIDDEPLALEIMERHINGFPSLKLMNIFEDAVSAGEYLKKYPVDLLFIDINMPDITGIDLVRSLAEKPMIIFTTAYKKFAFEGFELEAIDYLLKPITAERFATAVNKAIDYAGYKHKNAEKKENDEAIYVHSEYRMIKINIGDIEYIESMQDYIKIYTAGAEKPVLTLMPMKNILGKLPGDQFVRIHRSYIVSLNHVKSVHNRKIQMKSIELPVGNFYADAVKTLFR